MRRSRVGITRFIAMQFTWVGLIGGLPSLIPLLMLLGEADRARDPSRASSSA